MFSFWSLFSEFEKSDEQKYEFAAKNKIDYDDWLTLIKSSRLGFYIFT